MFAFQWIVLHNRPSSLWKIKRAEELYLLKFHLEDFDIFVSLKKCADICITYDFLCNNRLCQNVGFSRIHCRAILLDATYTFARERIRFCFFLQRKSRRILFFASYGRLLHLQKSANFRFHEAERRRSARAERFKL